MSVTYDCPLSGGWALASGLGGGGGGDEDITKPVFENADVIQPDVDAVMPHCCGMTYIISGHDH